MEEIEQPQELTPNEIRGIDICIKGLSKKYNFIKGWSPEDDYLKYNNTLFINLDVDYNMVSDYFGVRIRPYIKQGLKDKDPDWYGRDIYSLLALTDMPNDSDVSYDVKKAMSASINRVYPQLPEKYIRTYPYESFDGVKYYPVVISVMSFKIY